MVVATAHRIYKALFDIRVLSDSKGFYKSIV